ncbi:MAG TPA: hypothetical protein VGI10_04340 [Polyangiaceae bacterium]|jgi:hypothetical protein
MGEQQTAVPTTSSKPEAVHDAMTRLGGYDAEPAASAPTSAPAAKPTPKPAKGSKSVAKPVRNAAPDASSRLRELAQKLGVDVEDRPVLTRERAAARQERRDKRVALDSHMATSQRALREQIAKHGPIVKGVAAIRHAMDQGGPDDFAKALGFGGWEEFLTTAHRAKSDPNHHRVRALEQQLTQKQRDESARAARARQDAQQTERAQAQRRYQSELQARCSNSTNKIVRAMSSDPQFVATIMEIQRENWDGQRTVTPEQALMMSVGGGRPVIGELRRLAQKLSKALGSGEQAPAASNGGKANGSRSNGSRSNGKSPMVSKDRKVLAAEIARRLAEEVDE